MEPVHVELSDEGGDIGVLEVLAFRVLATEADPKNEGTLE